MSDRLTGREIVHALTFHFTGHLIAMTKWKHILVLLISAAQVSVERRYN